MGPGLRISDFELTRLLRTDLRLWQQMARSLALASQLAMTAINDLMDKSPKRRLAAAMLRVTGHRNNEALGDDFTEIELTHADLASLTNLSRSTVAQYLHQLESDGFLEYRYGKIRLIKPLRLREWLQTEPH